MLACLRCSPKWPFLFSFVSATHRVKIKKKSSMLCVCFQLYSATFYPCSTVFFVIRYTFFMTQGIFSLSLSYFKWFENPSSSSENVLASFVKLTVCLLAQVIAEKKSLRKVAKKESSQVFFLPPEQIFSPSSFYYRQTSLSFTSQICVPSSSTPVMIIWPPLALKSLSFITLQLHAKALL